MGFKDFLKREFQLSNLCLHHDKPHKFVNAQWNRVHSLIYVGYRWVTAIFLLAVAIVSGVQSSSAHHLIYLTNWTFLLLTFSHLVRACAALYWLIRRKGRLSSDDKVEGHMPWYLKTLWATFNASGAPSLTVTALYWSAVYEAEKGTDFIDVSIHGLNSVIVLLDHFVTGVPMRILHVHHPMIYGAIYSIFSGIYYAAGGKTFDGGHTIYSILDFKNNPGLAVGLLIASTLVVIPLLYLLLFALYHFRVYLYEKCCPADMDPEAKEGRSNSVSPEENQGFEGE